MAPAEVATAAGFEVELMASTEAGAGEAIGFFHAEYSDDGGRSWTPIAMDQNQPPRVQRRISLSAPTNPGLMLVRLRVAFRGGLAGDVDCNGAAIRWATDWMQWRRPPAVLATIRVVAR